jgi:hypothetical protein
MARLKFVPKAGLCVPYPGRGAGDLHFAGRTVVSDPLTKAIRNVADENPVEAEEGTVEAERFKQFVVRDGDMYPFDEATAKACGVPFVPVERGTDGEWSRVLPTSLAAEDAKSKSSRKAAE